MKISEMPAGREMDALVAEKVVGWQIRARGHRVWQPDIGCEVVGFDNIADCRRYITEECPPYSIDIAAAWQVVEKMGLTALDCGGEADTKWYANIGDGAYAPTAPLAICRAALLTVGVTEVP